jgi:5-methylcytosine-specific restriction endonuclease McrA/predicted nucleic acid-binding Zn ribbon protein
VHPCTVCGQPAPPQRQSCSARCLRVLLTRRLSGATAAIQFRAEGAHLHVDLSIKLTRPSRPCAMPGCPALRPCPRHPRAPFATATRSSNLYGTARWKRERAVFLRAHRTCTYVFFGEQPIASTTPEVCGAKATVVDHAIQHRGDETAFWDQSNWRALCWRHHQQKTGRETRERVIAG